MLINTAMENKTDLQLVEVLAKGHSGEVERAQAVLYERYYVKLTNVASGKIQRDKNIEVHDVVQEVFLRCMDRFTTGEVKLRNVEAYLTESVIKKCIDVLRGWEVEDRFEQNIPVDPNNYISEATLKALEEPSEQLIERQSWWETLKLSFQLPYAAGLADCPRTVWILRQIYQYPTTVIARLLDKSPGTISTHYSVAAAEIERYCQSEDFDFDLEVEKRKIERSCGIPENATHLIERPKNMQIARLTPDELEPFYDFNSFGQWYSTSLEFPGPMIFDKCANDCAPGMLPPIGLRIHPLHQWESINELLEKALLPYIPPRFNHGRPATDPLQKEISERRYLGHEKYDAFFIEVDDNHITLTFDDSYHLYHNYFDVYPDYDMDPWIPDKTYHEGSFLRVYVPSVYMVRHDKRTQEKKYHRALYRERLEREYNFAVRRYPNMLRNWPAYRNWSWHPWSPERKFGVVYFVDGTRIARREK